MCLGDCRLGRQIEGQEVRWKLASPELRKWSEGLKRPLRLNFTRHGALRDERREMGREEPGDLRGSLRYLSETDTGGRTSWKGQREPRLTLREGQRACASLAGPDSLTNLGAGPGGLAALRRGLSNPRPRATVL